MKISGKSSTYTLQAEVLQVFAANPAARLQGRELVQLLALAPLSLPPDRTEISRCLSRLFARGYLARQLAPSSPQRGRGGRAMSYAYCFADTSGAKQNASADQSSL